MTSANPNERYISCFADSEAFSLSFRPRYWEHTTAPPVAKALKMNTKRFARLSTRETPETTASPSDATIMVSIIPIVTFRSVSISRGIIKVSRYLLSKSRSFLSIRTLLMAFYIHPYYQIVNKFLQNKFKKSCRGRFNTKKYGFYISELIYEKSR